MSALEAPVEVHELEILDTLMAEVWAWHERELGPGTVTGKAAKVCEEAGELVGHVIKSQEPRHDAAEHALKAHDEIADVILSALGAARALGIERVSEVVYAKWQQTKAREFLTARAREPKALIEQAARRRRETYVRGLPGGVSTEAVWTDFIDEVVGILGYGPVVHDERCEQNPDVFRPTCYCAQRTWAPHG